MATINEIRLRIQELYHDNPDIHIDVSMNRPRIHIVNQADILIKRIRIAEF